MNASGAVAVRTGSECIEYAGHLTGDGWSAQGNLLATPAVVEAMAAAYEASQGPLVERMLIALEAAEAAPAINSGDTAWIIVSTALVMMMTPAGLALFYGGMSRYKNLLNTLAMTFATYCLVSVVWVLWGYSLAFGESASSLIGSLNHVFLAGIDVNSLSGSIPTIVFVLFQMTFAGITVALVLGSIVDRMKFSSWIVFTVLWVTFIYCPIAHWVWGGGWLGSMGLQDFAGGTVVHITAGVAALVAALVMGPRTGFQSVAGESARNQGQDNVQHHR